jgi:hypothetical protein
MDNTYIFSAVIVTVCAVVVAVFQVLIFLYEKMGGAGLNLFYRRKADELEIQIEAVLEKQREYNKVLFEVKEAQREVQKAQNELNKNISLLISKLNQNDT